MNTTFVRFLGAMIVGGVLTGCSGPAVGVDPSSVTGIPSSWLEDTAKEWPDSDGYGQSVPRFDGRVEGQCLLTDKGPELMGEQFELSTEGWGSYGMDDEATDAYRYVCNIRVPDNYSGEMQLLQADGADLAQATLNDFLGTQSIPEQDNTVTTVQSSQLEVHVLKTWYPTNPTPHGSSTALYLDDAQDALFWLRITSLDDEQFDEYSDQQAADDLVALLAGATES